MRSVADRRDRRDGRPEGDGGGRGLVNGGDGGCGLLGGDGGGGGPEDEDGWLVGRDEGRRVEGDGRGTYLEPPKGPVLTVVDGVVRPAVTVP